jgi:hypothetical protein
VNFVGHIAIGMRSRRDAPDVEFLVGTALPDFASMARLHLAPDNGPLGRGMALHHEADGVFHRHGWFLDLERELHDALAADGLPRGGALACAHVGVELLLDGELVRDATTGAAVDGVFGAIADPDAAVVATAPAPERMRWRDHLASVAARLDPRDYGNPESVAERLQRITARRPRLAFAPEHVPTVAERLAAVQPRIAADAAVVVDDVAGGVGLR